MAQPITPSLNRYERQIRELQARINREADEYALLKTVFDEQRATMRPKHWKKSPVAQRMRQISGNRTRFREDIKELRMQSKGYSGQDPYGRTDLSAPSNILSSIERSRRDTAARQAIADKGAEFRTSVKQALRILKKHSPIRYAYTLNRGAPNELLRYYGDNMDSTRAPPPHRSEPRTDRVPPPETVTMGSTPWWLIPPYVQTGYQKAKEGAIHLGSKADEWLSRTPTYDQGGDPDPLKLKLIEQHQRLREATKREHEKLYQDEEEGTFKNADLNFVMKHLYGLADHMDARLQERRGDNFLPFRLSRDKTPVRDAVTGLYYVPSSLMHLPEFAVGAATTLVAPRYAYQTTWRPMAQGFYQSPIASSVNLLATGKLLKAAQKPFRPTDVSSSPYANPTRSIIARRYGRYADDVGEGISSAWEMNRNQLRSFSKEKLGGAVEKIKLTRDQTARHESMTRAMQLVDEMRLAGKIPDEPFAFHISRDTSVGAELPLRLAEQLQRDLQGRTKGGSSKYSRRTMQELETARLTQDWDVMLEEFGRSSADITPSQLLKSPFETFDKNYAARAFLLAKGKKAKELANWQHIRFLDSLKRQVHQDVAKRYLTPEQAEAIVAHSSIKGLVNKGSYFNALSIIDLAQRGHYTIDQVYRYFKEKPLKELFEGKDFDAELNSLFERGAETAFKQLKERLNKKLKVDATARDVRVTQKGLYDIPPETATYPDYINSFVDKYFREGQHIRFEPHPNYPLSVGGEFGLPGVATPSKFSLRQLWEPKELAARKSAKSLSEQLQHDSLIDLTRDKSAYKRLKKAFIQRFRNKAKLAGTNKQKVNRIAEMLEDSFDGAFQERPKSHKRAGEIIRGLYLDFIQDKRIPSEMKNAVQYAADSTVRGALDYGKTLDIGEPIPGMAQIRIPPEVEGGLGKPLVEVSGPDTFPKVLKTVEYDVHGKPYTGMGQEGIMTHLRSMVGAKATDFVDIRNVLESQRKLFLDQISAAKNIAQRRYLKRLLNEFDSYAEHALHGAASENPLTQLGHSVHRYSPLWVRRPPRRTSTGLETKQPEALTRRAAAQQLSRELRSLKRQDPARYNELSTQHGTRHYKRLAQRMLDRKGTQSYQSLLRDYQRYARSKGRPYSYTYRPSYNRGYPKHYTRGGYKGEDPYQQYGPYTPYTPSYTPTYTPTYTPPYTPEYPRYPPYTPVPPPPEKPPPRAPPKPKEKGKTAAFGLADLSSRTYAYQPVMTDGRRTAQGAWYQDKSSAHSSGQELTDHTTATRYTVRRAPVHPERQRVLPRKPTYPGAHKFTQTKRGMVEHNKFRRDKPGEQQGPGILSLLNRGKRVATT